MMKTPSRKQTHPGNIILSAIAVIVIIGAVVYFTNYLLTGRKYFETNDAQVESYITPISARLGGSIKHVKFQEYEWVKEGDTLLTIDDREYRICITKAEAAVEAAKARLIILSADIASAEVGTLVNKEQIDGARAKIAQQQSDTKRYKNLTKRESTTGSDLEIVQPPYDASLIDYNAAENSLKNSYAKIAELRSRKAVLIADLKINAALLDLAHINLSYTVIRAPSAGRTGRKAIQVGQQIQAGQPLVSIVEEKEKWVIANFKETQICGMYIGQPVDIRVDAIDNKVYHGQIEAISASTGAKVSLLPPDNATGNFVKIVQRVPVKIHFTSIDIAPLKAGMNVLVSVKKKAI